MERRKPNNLEMPAFKVCSVKTPSMWSMKSVRYYFYFVFLFLNFLRETLIANEIQVKKRYVSAKERKQMRRNSLLGEGEMKDDSVSEKQQKDKKAPIENQVIKNVRGTIGKLKKMKAKYGDQSDEERQLRMKLLGVLLFHFLLVFIFGKSNTNILLFIERIVVIGSACCW